MNPIITVNNLTKIFSVAQKPHGFLNQVKAFVNPSYKQITAVDNISFTVNSGEVIAFIGPNGAGKSTTIKMLTGILFPTAGSVTVAGLIPQEQRTKLAYKIGSVFGQRSQLWYHLPPADTYNLLQKIYEIPAARYKEQLTFLVDAFAIEELLRTPVRKLSLGQRMRCEIVASLLHRPEIIFLDEPTIGLDVIAKQQVRDVLKHLNEQEGTTIFLTSHDAGDIEAITKRTVIINHGTIVFDGATAELKKEYITSKVIELVVAESNPHFNFPGGTILAQEAHRIKIEIDTSVSSIERLISYALEHFTVVDINIFDTPLETIISSIYQRPRA